MVTRRLLIRAILTITLSTLAFFAIACGLWWFVMARTVTDLGKSLGGCDSSNPPEIEDVARFSLPPSYQNLESSCFGLQGWGAFARFEMAPADLDVFVASTLVDMPLSTSEIPARSFFPKDISSYLYGKHEANGLSQYILIDTSDRASYVVYLEVVGG